jgi:glycosyltransferase involved in cell wall biosynthesis
MENNLKIMFLDTRPVRRGAQVFVHELKKQFETAGAIVKRIFLYKEVHFECLPLNHNDRVLDFKDNHWMEKYLFFQPTLLMELSEIINQFNPDVILCNGSRTLKYAALVKRFNPDLKAKWVYRVIDSAQYWNRNPMVVWSYKKFIISAMDGAVGVSNKSLQEMKVHYQFNKPSIAIPRAIDIPHFTKFVPDRDLRKSWGIAEGAFVVLFLGNFTRQKRPDRFVEVIQSVKEKYPQVHGLMVGDGSLKNDTIRIIQQAGVEYAFTFTGYQQDVRPFISMCDILMLTSDTEGMPGVVLEAAAMSKTTISSDVGGITEFLKHRENGLVLNINSVPEFSYHLIDLIQNKNDLKKMALKSQNSVVAGYSLDDIALRYIDFFKSVLEKKELNNA